MKRWETIAATYRKNCANFQITLFLWRTEWCELFPIQSSHEVIPLILHTKVHLKISIRLHQTWWSKRMYSIRFSHFHKSSSVVSIGIKFMNDTQPLTTSSVAHKTMRPLAMVFLWSLRCCNWHTPFVWRPLAPWPCTLSSTFVFYSV